MEINGRLVADAAVRETKSGKKVTGFTIAINDKAIVQKVATGCKSPLM